MMYFLENPKNDNLCTNHIHVVVELVYPKKESNTLVLINSEFASTLIAPLFTHSDPMVNNAIMKVPTSALSDVEAWAWTTSTWTMLGSKDGWCSIHPLRALKVWQNW